MYQVTGINSMGQTIVSLEAYTLRTAQTHVESLLRAGDLYDGLEQVIVEHDDGQVERHFITG